MTDFGVALVEIPIVAGKLDEAVKIFDEHPHGLKFTSSQPGFISMTMSKADDKNSIILMERWTKKEDWIAYGGRRAVKEGELGESNKAWEGGRSADGRRAPADGRVRRREILREGPVKAVSATDAIPELDRCTACER